MKSPFRSIKRTHRDGSLAHTDIFTSVATSGTIKRERKSTDAFGHFPGVLRPRRMSGRQFLSVKQPLPTEIQLRITVTAQPNSPTKNMTSSTRIANTANLKAMIGPFSRRQVGRSVSRLVDIEPPMRIESGIAQAAHS